MSGKITKIISIYENILSSIDCKVSEDGRVVHNVGVEDTIVSIKTANPDERKPLYLPTTDNLSIKDIDGIFFHPLADTVTRGESPVIQWLKQMFILKIALATAEIGRTILTVAARGNPMDMPSDQLEVISRVSSGKDVKEQILERWTKMILAATGSPTGPLVSIYIKRDAIDTTSTEIDSDRRTFKRAAVVSMPLLKILRKSRVEKEGKILGVDFAGYELEILERLFNEMFPDGILDSTYSVFSNTVYAPSFTVLIQAFAKILASLQKIRDKFANQLPEEGPSKINTSWVIDIADFPQYTGIIPDLDGNNSPSRAPDRGMANIDGDYIGDKEREDSRRYREAESRRGQDRGRDRDRDRDNDRHRGRSSGGLKTVKEVEEEQKSDRLYASNQDEINIRHRMNSYGDGNDIAEQLRRDRSRDRDDRGRDRDRDRDRDRGRSRRRYDDDDDYDDRRSGYHQPLRRRRY